MHGGGKAKYPRGSSHHGGRRPILHLYRSVLRAAEQGVFDAAKVGDLDAEIRLAKTSLHMYLVENGLKLAGGQIVSSSQSEHGSSQSIQLHTDIVLRHLDRIGKLEKIRAEICALLPPEGGEPEGYDAWIAARQAEDSSARSASLPPSPQGSQSEGK